MRLLAAYLVVLLLFVAGASAADPAAREAEVHQRLKSQIDRIRLIDTHEHLCSEAERLKQPADCLAVMLNYVESDLISAGLPRSCLLSEWQTTLQDGSKPFERRWARFEKYWPDVRLTGYGRALRRATADLYGVPFDAPTLETGLQLNRRMADALKPGLYRHVLKEKARIDLSIVDLGTTNVDREFFAPVLRFDHFIYLQSAAQLDGLAKQTGVKIRTLEDLERALRTAFKKGKRDGMVGVKSGLAYYRSIHYPKPTDDEARLSFALLLSKKSPTEQDVLPLQNHMMHQVCQLVAKYRMPFQIHTGLQTAFGKREITDSRPTHLVNLIRSYPDAKFVIFHGSYPYGHELGSIAKNFQNAYIDMCWLHIISPKTARENLSEWIDAVPANKIMAFGGDYVFVEGAYAHAEMARENVARVLTEKVTAGDLTEAEAVELARKVLRTNAVALYGLAVK